MDKLCELAAELLVQIRAEGTPKDARRVFERVMKSSRIADPKNLTEVLDLIDRDEHIVNYARTHARELKAKLALVR